LSEQHPNAGHKIGTFNARSEREIRWAVR
jgi:hypothetical protein